MKLHGIFPPVTVPFDSRGDVDRAGLKSNIARYNKTKLAGYVVNGSTGESVLLTWEEIYDVWSAARDGASAEKILIAGSGAESTGETITHTKRAAKLGYHAALVRTPSYYKPLMTFEAEATHFFRVADASPIPILVYSVPVFTGYTVEAPLLSHLASHPNIIGIKDSSGNVQRIRDMVSSTPKSFGTLTGSAQTLQESLQAGAVGAILAVSCVFPDACVEFYEAICKGDTERAAQLKKQSVGPASTLVAKYGIPGIKCALDRLGYRGGAPRAPLLPIGEEAIQEIEAIISNATPATTLT
jgi:4-hydroxy-2-oxoglutarate aldolase